MSIMISMLRSRSEHVVKLSNEFVSWCHKYEGTTDKQGHEHRYIWDRRTISSSLQCFSFSMDLIFID